MRIFVPQASSLWISSSKGVGHVNSHLIGFAPLNIVSQERDIPKIQNWINLVQILLIRVIQL
jgi:hypothetical protein